MTVTIHIGVIETKYANSKKSVGTGDVATFLENRYGVLGGFVQAHITDIANDLAGSVKSQIKNLMLGAPAGNPFAQAEQDITNRAKLYISSGEAERVLAKGKPFPVPTQAAIDRKSGRMKSGRRKSQRPSFIDTGMYQGSLITWTDADG